MSGSGSYRRTRDGRLQHERRVKDRKGSSLSVSACPDCGKLRYKSRKDAKAAARQHEAREGRIRVYACGDYWHVTGSGTAGTVAWYRERGAS